MKNPRKQILLFALTTCLLWTGLNFPAHAQSFEGITYLTEEYYPFNYTEQKQVKGLAVDLLRMIWDEMGAAHQPITIEPWARAYDHILHEPNTVLFSMGRTKEREEKFKWVGPITSSHLMLIAKKNKNITITTLDDLAGYRVGTILDDLSDLLLQDYKNTAKIESVAHMDLNIKKLMADRLDIIVYEERSWQKKLAKHNLSPDFFETLYILHDASPYYAFHKDTPIGLVQKFQQALDHIKTTPEFQELLDKYLD